MFYPPNCLIRVFNSSLEIISVAPVITNVFPFNYSENKLLNKKVVQLPERSIASSRFLDTFLFISFSLHFLLFYYYLMHNSNSIYFIQPAFNFIIFIFLIYLFIHCIAFFFAILFLLIYYSIVLFCSSI